MSNAMKRLQEKIGVGADGAFGPNTARAISNHYGLSAKRASHILGQSHHESAGFKRVSEGLYYSTPDRIQAVWPSRFKTVADAEPYAKNPKGLADKVYGGRMGNDGEGYKWRGRGFLQLTGKDNYSRFANEMDLNIVLDNPDLVEEEYAFDTAVWFFKANKLFDIADQGVTDDVIRKVTKRVNGGTHGLSDREKQTHMIYKWLAD